MSWKSKSFVGLVLTLGVAAAVDAMMHWSGTNLSRFGIYLLLALLAAGLKVRLPKLDGSMSVNFPFILLGLAGLDPAQTMILGCASIAVQCFFKVKKNFAPVQIAFNVANIAVAIAIAEFIFNLGVLAPFGTAVRLFAAACCYFLSNTLAVSAIIALEEKKNSLRLWREFFFWSFPYYLIAAAIVLGVNALVVRFGSTVVLLVIPVAYGIYASYRAYFGRLEDQMLHAEQMAALHLRTIEALALAIEAKDQTTHRHLNRVRVYACALAEKLGLAQEQQEAVRAASLLHDIGKLAVPEHIISKPGKLSAEEFEKMKIHPVVGAEILGRVQFPYPVVPIVRSHHEKWDGSGYPDGLQGEDIPIGARIISVVDCLDALASDRQYRKALPLDEAMEVVKSLAGKAFDPQVVEILAQNFRELEARATREGEVHERLNTDIVVNRGIAPAAGFESDSAPTAATATESFLNSIASARQEAQTLYELSQELGSSLRLEDTLSVLDARLRGLIPFDTVAVFLEREGVLETRFVSGPDQQMLASLRIPLGEGLSGWVAQNRKPILNGNPSVEPGYLNDKKFTILRSAIAVPLEGVNGMRGVFALYSRNKDAFGTDHLRVLLAVASKVALTVENSLHFQQVESSATTDYLTKLPNARSLFVHLDREISRAKRHGSAITVLVCDLNGFKDVNDKHGHLEGNHVLATVAEALRESCREYDYAARMGGDEFVVVLPGLMHEHDVENRISSITSAIEQATKGLPAEGISMSIGRAVYPTDGQTAEDLLSEADRSMYNRKQNHYRLKRMEQGAAAAASNSVQ